ncbi:hypothetical protein D3C76_1816770 [compost metagenome]
MPGNEVGHVEIAVLAVRGDMGDELPTSRAEVEWERQLRSEGQGRLDVMPDVLRRYTVHK